MSDSTIYRIQAYNEQAIYAYGTKAQAIAYSDYLDARRTINLHGVYETTAAEQAAHADDCVILDDELAIRDAGEP